MNKVISKEGALKVFYFLMLVDGVTTFEKDCLREIGTELLGNTFSTVVGKIIYECESDISSAEANNERYDLIQEGIDRALNETAPSVAEGLVPRLLVWNMLTLAYSDSDYSENENRLISHVVRILQIDKSVFAEMKQLINVAHSIQEEKETLENSPRPYSEVRLIIEEIEKRKQIIIKAAMALISDELIEDTEEQKSENVIQTMGKKIDESVEIGRIKVSEKVAPLAKNAKEKATEGIKETSSFVSKTAEKGVGTLKTGAGKFISKIKDATKKS